MKEATDVTMLLYREWDKKFLMQERTLINPKTGKPPRYPGAFCFPGEGKKKDPTTGKVIETTSQAVVRGALQEYELIVDPSRFRLVTTYEHDSTDVDDGVFIPFGFDQKPILHEGKTFHWMTLEEIKKLEPADPEKASDTPKLGFEEWKIIPAIEDFLSAMAAAK